MKVQWIELSTQKRKALYIILKQHEKSIEEIGGELGVTRKTIFNKLNETTKFKEHEYIKLLNIIGITDEELEKCADSYILKFL